MIDVVVTDGVLPSKAKPGDAGWDLFTPEDFVLRPRERRLQRTGLVVAVPFGCVGFVCPRSGNAWKRGVAVTNAPGTLDSGYRGDLGVILWHTETHPTQCLVWDSSSWLEADSGAALTGCNCGAEKETSFKRGDAIGQLVVLELAPIGLRQVDKLDATERGASGFGSTDGRVA